MKIWLPTLLLALPLHLAAGEADSKAELAKARTAYAERTAEIEKALGKKGKSGKGRLDYLEAKGTAIADLLLAMESRYRDAKYSEKKVDEAKALQDEKEELDKQLEEMHKDGAVILRPPVNQGHAVLKWGAMPGDGSVDYGEHFVAPEIDEEGLLRWLNIGRGGYFGFGQQKESVLWWDTAKEDGIIELSFNPGQHAAHWFYFRSPRAQKVEIALEISKGDTIEKLWVNLQEVSAKKGKLKAEFREGMNILILHTCNKKEMPYSLTVKVEAKDLEIGTGKPKPKK